jgi:nitroreductase
MNNSVIDCLLNHRSIRKFKDQPVEADKLELILRAGTRAATGGNLQLYSFIVIDNEDKKKALDKAWPARFIYIAKSPVAIIALVDQYRVMRWLKLNSDREICNNRPLNFLLSMWDALIALQNMVVAAESLGLGTCYIGSILEMNIQELLGAPEYVFPAGLVCMGYPDEDNELSMRLPLEAVVHKNNYHIPTDEEISEWYRERDNVWETVSDNLKARLKEDNIFGIAQALAKQRYSKEVVEKRSQPIIENLKRSKFDLSGY